MHSDFCITKFDGIELQMESYSMFHTHAIKFNIFKIFDHTFSHTHAHALTNSQSYYTQSTIYTVPVGTDCRNKIPV